MGTVTSRRSRTPRRRYFLLPIAVAIGLFASILAPATSPVASLEASSDGTAAREPLLRPDDLGDGTLDSLQYPDVTEGLSLVEPPEPDSSGGAQVSYPIIVPPGRGITPDVSLQYDSGGGNGWTGLGWDLSVGEISVDTSFGAPHFDPNYESETYALDGAILVPNANGGPWVPRVRGDRFDYTRLQETEFEQIIRHEVDEGGPDDYFWEVRDKHGNIRWYGGQPDGGGPFGALRTDGSGNPITIDRNAIVYDDHGNAVRWLLSAERDIGVNVVRYYYDTVTYARTTSGWSPQACNPNAVCGKHTYLKRIDYTEGAQASGAPPDAPYQIHFLRQSTVNPAATVRKDAVVDGSGRYLDVINDRLARIEVRYGPPNGGAARTYNRVAVRYDLEYLDGPFGKSLLKAVTQVGNPASESARHDFVYNDDILGAGGAYNGFDARTRWNTGEDMSDRVLLDASVSAGALGSSESNSGEGHAYIGFNPLVAQKVGSFGGSIQIGVGGTEALAEWIDLDGDGLPDKVYRDGGAVKFRLNESGPDGGDTFGGRNDVGGSLPRLSREINVTFQLSVEAHYGISAIFGLGGSVSIGDTYFTDVNGDGLPDFVNGGQVLFNRLVSGIPTFQANSSGTIIPLPTGGGTPNQTVDEIADMQADLEAMSPPIDTIRRWTAPYTGTVSIDGKVTMAGVNSPDGVRVAIQHDGTEIGASNLLASGSSAFAAPFSRNVDKGDQIYFRVGSVNDGQRDEVTWDPTITYTAISGVTDIDTVPVDVNGLSQTSFNASDDFTLAGRPDSGAVMPYTGTVQMTATVHKAAATTDEVRVVVLHNGVPVAVPSATIAAGFTGDHAVSVDFDVDGPVYPTPSNPDADPKQDTVEVYLAADSPIDLTALNWRPKLTYLNATDANGAPVDTTNDSGDPIIQVELLPEIEQYPNVVNVPAASVSTPWVAGGGTYDLVVGLGRLSGPAGEAVVTVKDTKGALVAKDTIALSPGPVVESIVADLDAKLVGGTGYFFDVMIRDPDVSDGTSFGGASLRPNGNTDDSGDISVPAALRWRGRQTLFPLAYRGWAAAGYTAAGVKATQPIDPAAFESAVDSSKFDENNKPDGFEDLDADGDGRTDSPGDSTEPAYAFVPVSEARPIPGAPAPIAGPFWRGPRDSHAVSPGKMRTSRYGADSVALGGGGVQAGAGTGVTRVGVAAPSAALAVGLGPFGGSFGVAPSFGLRDFSDMNGDRYPDVLTPGSIHYTDQRGAFLANSTGVSDLAVINQDLTLSISGGLGVKLVDIKGNGKGKTNTAGGGQAAGRGGDANDASGGVEVGGGLGHSWTSPNASGGDPDPGQSYSAELGKVPDGSTGGADIQVALADVNADGLADRVFTTPGGVFAQYNLGYEFTTQAVELSNGGFQAMESTSANASVGFSTPWAEFGGGLALNWNYDWANYTWRDVNGDGLLDQVHTTGGTPTVAFGTGSGVLPAVQYGALEEEGVGIVPGAQQVSYDVGTGLGGAFDFTIYIGPLCIAVCYLVINPGASYQNTVTSTQIDLQDVNGDGYADSVSTTDDDELWVRLNRHGATNLLEAVKNPLGGTINLSYQRAGNTVDHPDTTWVMNRVAVDDGRPGDGADVIATNYEYSGLRYDRVHRRSLGFGQITAREMNTKVAPEQPLRITVKTFHNENVFSTGLEKSVTVTEPNGTLLRTASSTWGFRDVLDIPAGFDPRAAVSPVDVTQTGTTDSVGSRGRSIAPLVTRVDEKYYEGGAAVQSTFTTFVYDGLGNVLTQHDVGEPEDPDDDVLTTFGYTDCHNAASTDLGCPTTGLTSTRIRKVTKPSPLWSADLCPTWASLPVVVHATNGKTGGGEVVYRHREGPTDVCNNASMTRLEESIDGTEVALTQLSYSAFGLYDRIVYPPGEDGVRYAVKYVYDADRNSDVAEVTEYMLPDDDAVDAFLDYDDSTVPNADEGLTSTATFDPLAGRIASRTDANGNTVNYTYDSIARIKSISSPRPQDTDPLVTFDYHPSAPGYAYARARHLDVFNPGNTIDTYSFVDGTGRSTQTKRDARLFQAADQPPVVGRSVSGATNWDPLGRPYEQFYASQDTQTDPTKYETATAAVPPEVRTFDARDRLVQVVQPGGRTTLFAYGAGSPGDGLPTYFTTRITAPNNRAKTDYVDVRGVTQATDDQPAALAEPLQTIFDHDGVGQLRTVIDRAGNQTTHEYDRLGRVIATDTPDGGLVEFGFDAEGKLVTKVTPNLRADGTEISYDYNFGKLTGIDYPGNTPDVAYEYGTEGDPHNGAGRIVREEDGSRIVTMEYAPSGAMTKQVAEMKYHDWFNDGADKSKFRWTTEWSYDGLGRLESMVYPDGEELTYDYDEGGLPKSVVGEEEGLIRVLVGTDPFGNPIYEDQPHTWAYDYATDRQYDEFFRVRWERLGNGVTTEYTFDPNTQWLDRLQSFSPNRSVADPAHFEIQDLNYEYDIVGNPTEYRNELAPALSSEFLGSSIQKYKYDPLERVVGGDGAYELADKRHQRYTFGLTYDDEGNVTSKKQYDATVKQPFSFTLSPSPNRGDLPNAATTYSFNRRYQEPEPHQATGVDKTSYHYDANGNFLGIKDSKDKWIRRVEWDASDRMRVVTDGPSSTEYRYDDSGQRTIERGPAGETAFVNPWVTTRNKNEMFKHIWIADNRVATQRDDEPYEELKRYFIHKDLQGGTNVVTDYQGDTFQHHEYFPTGEVWINENSTVFRTPYQYAGSYVDEVRKIISIGARWYDQNREFFYASDPVLVDDPAAMMRSPGLTSAYSYAGSNPLTFIDPSGFEFFTAQSRMAVAAKYEDRKTDLWNATPKMRDRMAASIETRLPKRLVRWSLNIQDRQKTLDFAEFFQKKALFEFDRNEGKIKLSFGFGKQWDKGTFGKTAQDDAGGDQTVADAAAADGGPAAGNAGQDGAPAPPAADNDADNTDEGEASAGGSFDDDSSEDFNPIVAGPGAANDDPGNNARADGVGAE